MKLNQLISLWLVLTILLAMSCTTHEKPAATIGKNEAIELARKELLRNGIRPDDYQMAVNSPQGEEDWVVTFAPRETFKMPGAGYWIMVEQKTGRVFFSAED